MKRLASFAVALTLTLSLTSVTGTSDLQGVPPWLCKFAPFLCSAS